MEQETGKIQVLPSEVVDRIAAGEVVQRPASALKELLENSLDAGANKIVVSVEKVVQGAGKKLDFSISDNGSGIGKADLPMAATRFATSKLTTVDDFFQLASFGFRGEALASISMVSHLTITSRTPQSSLAFECQYMDGKPTTTSSSSSSSSTSGGAGVGIKRCARTPGTTVKVQDLFYNVPHRLKALQPKDEYPRMLSILQSYAVQVARRGVGIVCQQQQARGKAQKIIIDLNTTNLSLVQALKQSTVNNDPNQLSTEAQQSATQQVIATIYGSHFEQHLLYVTTCQSSKSNNNDNNDDETSDLKTTPTHMEYWCEGFLTLPSLSSVDVQLKSATFLLFVNDRYVECPPLKRQLEELYASMTPWKKAPFLYLSIHVPPNHVDVNVHPTKTQVALLFLEDIVADIVSHMHTELAKQGRTFGSAKQNAKVLIQNPYQKQNTAADNKQSVRIEENAKEQSKKRTRTEQEDSEEDRTSEAESAVKKLKPPPPSNSQKSSRRSSSTNANTGTSTKAPPPSQLIRTSQATPVGALEPFLVKQVRSQTQTQSQSQSTLSSQTQSKASSTPSPMSMTPSSFTQESQSSEANNSVHHPPCPFAMASPGSNVDLSLPGAFAQLSQQCTCRAPSQTLLNTTNSPSIMLPKARIVRPAQVVATQSNLHSIRTLRGRVKKHLDKDLQQKLRQGYFVSVVSHHQSPIQWQEELCLINHASLAEALFYQLALARFDGNQIATLPGKIHVQTIIEQFMQAEDDWQGGGADTSVDDDEGLSPVSETNRQLAKQATSCLWDNAAMLEDYFGIRLELERPPVNNSDDDENVKPVVLTGLPILLDGHTPPPHGLPLFLLRLATEVNWEEERPCFDGVFRELGYYYAQMPSTTDTNEEGYKAYVQHTLFPALSYLLMPSQRLQAAATPLTLLSKLYKVFERC